MTEILASVCDTLADRAREAIAPDVTVGDSAVLVVLTHEGNKLAGLAHRPPGETERAPESISGLASLATDADTRLGRAVGIATLNALSAPDIDWEAGDPMVSLAPEATVVTTVGLFRPALRKFGGATVRVIERDPPAPESIDAPPDVTVETYGPADRAAAMAGADSCFVTGSALVYGGFESYLDAAGEAGVSSVVLIGSTASHLPDPAFDAGVDVVAGARVTDVAAVREGVQAGDCGTDLHDAGVEKVYVTAEHGLTDNQPTRETQP